MALLLAITCVLITQMGHASIFWTFTLQEISNDIRKSLIQWVVTLAISSEDLGVDFTFKV